jgi:hypothetical protein
MMQVKIEGDIHQGVAYYKKALLYADAMYNLGVAYGELLKFDMVISHFHSCVWCLLPLFILDMHYQSLL